MVFKKTDFVSVDIERENSVSIRIDGILRCRCLKVDRYWVDREFQEIYNARIKGKLVN